jgi:hypothetical protein
MGAPLTLLFLARGMRDFGDGFVAVLLPLHLLRLGFSAFEVGALAGAALLGSALSLAQIFYERGYPEDQDGEDQESNKPHAPHAAGARRPIISHHGEPHSILVILASANKAAALRERAIGRMARSPALTRPTVTRSDRRDHDSWSVVRSFSSRAVTTQQCESRYLSSRCLFTRRKPV